MNNSKIRKIKQQFYRFLTTLNEEAVLQTDHMRLEADQTDVFVRSHFLSVFSGPATSLKAPSPPLRLTSCPPG